MGPKVKKPPKNAFSFFLDEYVNNLRGKGRLISHKEAAEECGFLWKDLSEKEKEKYKKLADNYKGQVKERKENKFTCTGVSLAQLEREQNELKQKIEREDKEIKTTISNLDSESIKHTLFYIIHCNYYCKTDDGLYIPGELAISEFCLRDGVRRTLHIMIDPGEIPLGYAYETKQIIEEVHGLPYPPFDAGNSNYSDIYEKILTFLEPGKFPDGRYPPLYCIENNIKASENILQTLSHSCSENSNVFRVYHLHKFFFSLKNKCVEDLDDVTHGFPVLSIVENEITKDTFRYTPGIACSFHLNSDDKFYSCSLSVVQRYVFTICDHCCQYVDVQLIPGKHVRVNSDLNPKATALKRAKRKKKREEMSRTEESDFDRGSSYVDDASSFFYRKNQGGSFLHDEIESNFSALEVSSIASSRWASNFNAGSSAISQTSERKELKKELEDLEKHLEDKLRVERDDSP